MLSSHNIALSHRLIVYASCHLYHSFPRFTTVKKLSCKKIKNLFYHIRLHGWTENGRMASIPLFPFVPGHAGLQVPTWISQAFAGVFADQRYALQ